MSFRGVIRQMINTQNLTVKIVSKHSSNEKENENPLEY